MSFHFHGPLVARSAVVVLVSFSFHCSLGIFLCVLYFLFLIPVEIFLYLFFDPSPCLVCLEETQRQKEGWLIPLEVGSRCLGWSLWAFHPVTQHIFWQSHGCRFDRSGLMMCEFGHLRSGICTLRSMLSVSVPKSRKLVTEYLALLN